MGSASKRFSSFHTPSTSVLNPFARSLFSALSGLAESRAHVRGRGVERARTRIVPEPGTTNGTASGVMVKRRGSDISGSLPRALTCHV